MNFKWFGPVALLAALWIGDQIRINRPGHKYRLTVEVETPEGVKSGSGVFAVTPDRGYSRKGHTRTSGDAARVTVENRGSTVLGFPLGALWYHFEYEAYDDPLPDDVHRFHACYRREHPTTAVGDRPNVTLHQAPNLDGKENYVALDTRGEGRMVGLLLEIDNVQGPLWYGEGDWQHVIGSVAAACLVHDVKGVALKILEGVLPKTPSEKLLDAM